VVTRKGLKHLEQEKILAVNYSYFFLSLLVYCTYSKGVIVQISPVVGQCGEKERTTAFEMGKNTLVELQYFFNKHLIIVQTVREILSNCTFVSMFF